MSAALAGRLRDAGPAYDGDTPWNKKLAARILEHAKYTDSGPPPGAGGAAQGSPLDEDAARRTALDLAAKQPDAIGPEAYGTERLRRVFGKSAPLESLDAGLLCGSVRRIIIRKRRASPSLKKRQELRKMPPLCRKGEIDPILTQPLTAFSQTACNAVNTV